MQTYTVEFVKSDKTAFKTTDGKWKNRDKYKAPDFSQLKPGDTITTPEDGDFIKSFTVTGAQSLPSSGGTGSHKSEDHGSTRDASIARAVALKAAVDAKILDNSDSGSFAASFATFKDTVDEFFTYLTTGKFSEDK